MNPPPCRAVKLDQPKEPPHCPSATGGGVLGLARPGRDAMRRSLDFRRAGHKLIRENRVFVDLLDFRRQIGLDVLARMEEGA